MKINDIDGVIADVRLQLENDKAVSPTLKALIDMLIVIITLLVNRLGLNSKNSSKPPSTDFGNNNPPPDGKDKGKSKKKRGGQDGHTGTTLKQIENPDITVPIPIDMSKLPEGNYVDAGVEKRQVFDIEIRTVVTEYQAQVVINEEGRRFTAEFPKGVNSYVQYGDGVKAHAVYLSQYQLLPYERIQEYFADQLDLPLSKGTLYNFNQQAKDKIDEHKVMDFIANQLLNSAVVHVDETGMNIDGKNAWLHTASTCHFTYYYPHEKRGNEATKAANFLPRYEGIAVHDHWKSYFSYPCQHALCNAHHLRELTRAFEQDKQQWAESMRVFLEETNIAVKENGGALSEEQAEEKRTTYRAILTAGETECPADFDEKGKKKRKQSKSRNLLERLIEYEEETLRFMINPAVPFTNNQAENDIRMTKVHQKISGCFRSKTGAEIFCKVRSYISTCRKQGLSATYSLTMLFAGTLPKIFTPE